MKLTFDQKWAMFVGMAAAKLEANGFNDNAYECAKSLDMSFEEDYLHADLDDWEDMMQGNINEFKEDAPELFAEIH